MVETQKHYAKRKEQDFKKNHIYCMILLEHVEKGKTEIRSVVPGDEGGKGD